MTAAPAPVYWKLPHPMVYVLASGIYWRAACDCHFGRVIGVNPHAQRGTK